MFPFYRLLFPYWLILNKHLFYQIFTDSIIQKHKVGIKDTERRNQSYLSFNMFRGLGQTHNKSSILLKYDGCEKVTQATIYVHPASLEKQGENLKLFGEYRSQSMPCVFYFPKYSSLSILTYFFLFFAGTEMQQTLIKYF